MTRESEWTPHGILTESARIPDVEKRREEKRRSSGDHTVADSTRNPSGQVTSQILEKHIDKPSDRHRCVLISPTQLRCLDCQHTIELATRTSAAGRNQPAGIRDHDRCPHHVGQRRTTCGPCRADDLAGDTP